MAEILQIENDGPLITSTNFYHTEMARTGKFYLSSNAGAFRLLVPPQHLGAVREMRSARDVVVSRGPMTLQGQQLPDALEVLFDDGSEDPFSMHLSLGQVDRMPLDTDTLQEWTCTVWTHLVGERCRQVLSKPAHYRRVRRLPDLRPWHP
jgi:hypothetical protein